MARELKVDKLSDEFGLYALQISCGGCGHERRAAPKTLGKLCGWDAKLADVAKRMRCSKCGKKACRLTAVEQGRGLT